MQSKKPKPVSEVHILTEKTKMKFMPTNFLKQKKDGESSCLSKSQTQSNTPNKTQTSKISFLSSFWKKSIEEESDDTTNSVENGQINGNIDEGSTVMNEESEEEKTCRLSFCHKMTAEHVLIGNEYQLDLINILGVNSNKFVETEYLWSLRYKDHIDHVGIDQKKQNLLVVIAGRIMYIYKYDAKKLSTEVMVPFKEIKLDENPRLLQVVKDGNICLFFEDRLEIYLAGEVVHRRYNKKYDKPENIKQLDDEGKSKISYSLFMVPEPFENVINIFFEEKNRENNKIFTLWCIEMEFLASEIKSSPPSKVYDVKSSLRKTLTLKSYSKEIFLMNLGSEILALKKGYILDSANVNLKQEESFLEYIGNDTLLHISKEKIEVYSFMINLNVKPSRIVIKPMDSIKIYENERIDEFFKIFSILSSDMMIVFQQHSLNSRSKKGEIHYSFYITRSISRENKMNLLFPINTGEDFKIDDPVLLDKCDMAEKMGFSTRDIYLQLWNRSLQSRKEDYSILIATKDYNTINKEIIRKLKKSSMNFKEIQNIEEACFVMLEEKVFSSSCTEEAVMDYISSHFFKRKLEMFKDIQLMEKFEKENETGKESNEGFKMTIRQYQQYKSMEIKSELISLIDQFCQEGKTNLSRNIRFLLRNFKFVFRTIYYDILESIISNTKEKLLILIKEIPELLPYHPAEQESKLEIPIGFYEGIWPEISRQEENSSLYVDAITTIDNKEIILEQVIKSINFKRNWLSQHDMVTESRDKIKANYEKIKSPVTFYFFAAKIFEYIKDKSVLKEIVEFLEATYELPENIKGTIFLNERLYRFFIEKNIAPEINGRPYTLSEFFSFEDKQLIRHCFDKERSNKGLLLKDIKNIFKEVLQNQADEKYNKALLNYFISDLSEVSDLKYILNRINNQKLEFHQENEQMYEILVEALERKLKIGTDNDIPIEEVLIYIENIPLDENSLPLQELKSVEKIDNDSQMLRDAKVNMSIYDILHNYEEVFTKLIGHAVDTAEESLWRSHGDFEREFAIKKLAAFEIFSEEIYEENYSKVIFFIFLAKLCQKTDRITYAEFLLKNGQFKERVDANTAEGLVLYMEKWKLSNEKEFIKNEDYISELLKLIPEECNIHRYIRSEFEFAKLLSAPSHPVTFPISESILSSNDVKEIIFDLPIEFVMKLDIEYLFEVISTMQEILMEDMKSMYEEDGDEEMLITASNRITLHQLYEYVIIKMINCNKLREVLPYISKILHIEIANETYNIIYLILFIIKLSPELNETNKNNLLQCISYFFYHPIVLLEILDYLMNRPLSPQQMKNYIEEMLEKGKLVGIGYNIENPVFGLDRIEGDESLNIMAALQRASMNILQTKEEFKNIKYACIIIMLYNSPYALAKYISCSSIDDYHMKSIRSLLSYAINEAVFNPESLLELGRRIFIILLESTKSKNPIEVVIEQYEEISLENNTDIEGYEPPRDRTTFEYSMWRSAEAFRKKKLAFEHEQNIKRINSPPGSLIDKNERLKSSLGNPEDTEKMPTEYRFMEIDSDNENDDIINMEESTKEKRKIKETPKFDASMEMKNILQGGDKKNKLFLSTRGEMASKNSNSLSISIRQPNRTTNPSGYDSNKELKERNKKNEKSGNFGNEVMDLGESQHFQDFEQRSERELQLRPSSSAVESDSHRHSADSSPEIMHKEKIMEENYFSLKIDEAENRSRKFSEASGERSGISDGMDNPYEIQVKEVFDGDDFVDEGNGLFHNIHHNENDNDNDNDGIVNEIMVESTEFNSIPNDLSFHLLQINADSLEDPLADFNYEPLHMYDNQKNMILDVIRELFIGNCLQSNFYRVMKMILGIVEHFPVCELNAEIFAIIVKAQEAQAKTIPEIKFIELVTESMITTPYTSKRELFEKIYENLSKFIDSENIYKITQFVRRVFDNSNYEQEITSYFILELAKKINTCENEDRNWNIEKIQVNLNKVNFDVWNRKFKEFQNVILSSYYKQELLSVFCEYLSGKKGDEQAVKFIENVIEIDNSEILRETLDKIKN